jgi:hypothetical protein
LSLSAEVGRTTRILVYLKLAEDASTACRKKLPFAAAVGFTALSSGQQKSVVKVTPLAKQNLTSSFRREL